MQKNNQNRTNIHANCLILGNEGILVRGPSGSGKTMLMLHLLRHASANNQFAAMVADDQVFISNQNSQLVAECPSTTQGQVEIRGFGIDELNYVPSAVISLMVNIVTPEALERWPEKNSDSVSNIRLPFVSVPRYHWEQAINIITAKLTA